MVSAEAFIGKLLSEARRQGLTPQQMMDRTGLSYSAAWKLLKGKARQPTLEGTMALVSALNMSVELRSR
jgi:transcriptional regulator with XRE-family HTH domain